MAADSDIQRIARLTPLAAVLESFQTTVDPVAPREAALTDAVGRTLAADVAIAEAKPPTALALRDGYALRADATTDASSYAPAPLSPAPKRIDLGEPLPAGADAVAAIDTVTVDGARAEITAPVAPGEGVLAAGGDAPAGVLRLAGARLRRVDVALMQALGVTRVMIREPLLRIVRAGKGDVIEAAAGLVARAIAAEGGATISDSVPLEAALGRDDADAIVAVGGTGSGRNDASVKTLARLGHVAFHGIAIMPGETTALGFIGTRPVLILPGRLDAAIAASLTVGRRLLARLAFRLIEEQPFAAELSRKVASPLGLAEVVPVRRRLGKVEPVAQHYLPPQALARADGWILIPADSEGHAEGTRVMVRSWP